MCFGCWECTTDQSSLFLFLFLTHDQGGACTSGGNARSWAEANAAYDPEAAHIVLSSCGVPVLMYTWDVYLKVAFDVNELVAYGCVGAEQVELSLAKGGEEGGKGGEGTVEGGEGGEGGEGDEGVKETRPSLEPRCRTSLPSWTTLSTRLLLRDMRHFNMSAAHIGDAGAVAAVLCSEAIETKHYHVAVELEGKHTRGMTVCDVREEVFPPDQPQEAANVYVAVGVDAEALKAVYAQAVFMVQAVVEKGGVE